MNIPPPNYKVNGTLNMDFAGGPSNADPWSDYGLDETGYGDSALEQAYEYRSYALQQLQNGLSPQERQMMVDYLQELDRWIRQHEMMGDTMGGSDWDPLADPAYGNGVYTTGPTPTYQDLNQMIFEENVGPITAGKNESREQKFYGPPYDFTVPGSATATVTAEPDPDNPSKQRVVVTVRWADGTERKYSFYNVDWKNGDLTIRAGSPDDQIAIDASAAGIENIHTAELGGAEEGEEGGIQGTPPDEVEGDTRIWKNNTQVDYTVEEGNLDDRIYADVVNVTVPDRTYSVYVTKLGGHEYAVEFKDKDGKVIGKLHTYQTDQLNFFGVDAENLYSKSEIVSRGGGRPVSVLTSWENKGFEDDPQVSLEGEVQGTEIGETNSEETAATQAQGEIATTLEENSDLALINEKLKLQWYTFNNSNFYTFVTEFVSDGFKGIAKGMKEGDWSGLKSAMDKLWGKINDGGQWVDEKINNAFTGLFMSLYSVLGPSKLKTVIGKLSKEDPEIFNSFKNGFKPYIGGTSSTTINPVDTSILDEDGNETNPHAGVLWATGEWVPMDMQGWTYGDVDDFIDEAAEAGESNEPAEASESDA